MAAHVIQVEEAPDLEARIQRPGEAPKAAPGAKSTRFLGLPGEDFENPEKPPFAYHIRRPKGDVTADHRHAAGRTEYLIEGAIEWREAGKPPVVYGAGTLTYVEAGTVYGYTVLEDACILILFDQPPGMHYE